MPRRMDRLGPPSAKVQLDIVSDPAVERHRLAEPRAQDVDSLRLRRDAVVNEGEVALMKRSLGVRQLFSVELVPPDFEPR